MVCLAGLRVYEMLAAENRCIKRVLEAWEDLSGIKGAIISVNDRPAAFTVAEGLREDPC